MQGTLHFRVFKFSNARRMHKGLAKLDHYPWMQERCLHHDDMYLPMRLLVSCTKQQRRVLVLTSLSRKTRTDELEYFTPNGTTPDLPPQMANCLPRSALPFLKVCRRSTGSTAGSVSSNQVAVCSAAIAQLSVEWLRITRCMEVESQQLSVQLWWQKKKHFQEPSL